MTAYIICMNDSMSAVVLDDEEKAITEMGILKKKYWEKHSWFYTDYKEYSHLAYWHIHEAEVLE